ncbi:MAG: LysR family transcriptional regulator [Oleiphilaceae bacterium]|nr:LysR family transcriptional regulator [Oleiphilaceae bacterium]
MLVFLAVIDSGSFTAAAEKLDIPKANVSRKVSKLEDSFDVTLLERSTRSQRLTEVGYQYVDHCRKIQQEIDIANFSISEMKNEFGGQLRIGTSISIANEILRPSLSQFLMYYPDIDVDLRLLNQRIDLIEGGYDLLIHVGKLDDSRLVAKSLGCAKRYIYASPSYLKHNAPLKDLDDLTEHNILLMSHLAHRNQVDFYKQNSNKTKLTLIIKPKLLVDEFSIIKLAEIDSLGIAILPSYMCKEEAKEGSHVRVLNDWKMSDIGIYALFLKHRNKLPKLNAFLEHASKIFKEVLEQ